MTYEAYMDNEEKMVGVTDDWYPNWPGDKIKVRLIVFYDLKECDGYVLIQAIGYDDYYLELEYRVSSVRMAKDTYDSAKTIIYDKIPDGVNKRWFEKRGFKQGI